MLDYEMGRGEVESESPRERGAKNIEWLRERVEEIFCGEEREDE